MARNSDCFAKNDPHWAFGAAPKWMVAFAILSSLLLSIDCADGFAIDPGQRSFGKFHVNHHNNQRLALHSSSSLCILFAEAKTKSETRTSSNEITPSRYKTKEMDKRNFRIWKDRQQLSKLRVGDRLEGYLFQEHLDGTTGPKVFLECGVGQYNSVKGKWKIVHAMLRLGNQNAKPSATLKRVARLRKKTSIECFVSKVRLDNSQLEVVLNEVDVPDKSEPAKQIPVQSLKPGQELVGTVVKLVPYGAFVNVGANRLGLLHIQKVADLYGAYIDKEKGLEDAGLERGSKIKVQVESNDKKRVFLDFTTKVKEEAEQDRIERQKRKEEREKQKQDGDSQMASTSTQAVAAAGAVASVASLGSASAPSIAAPQTSKEEEDVWAAYAADNQSGDEDSDDDVYDDDDDDEDYDDYDEDRDIEDALGLGTY